jgi:hypothetical protein
MTFIDPEEVEEKLRECMEAMDDDDDLFSSWEVSFLEDLELYVEEHAITQKQWRKLRQIHEGKINA